MMCVDEEEGKYQANGIEIKIEINNQIRKKNGGGKKKIETGSVAMRTSRGAVPEDGCCCWSSALTTSLSG